MNGTTLALYAGSGPGAPGTALHVWSSESGETLPLRWGELAGLGDVSVRRGGGEAVAVGRRGSELQVWLHPLAATADAEPTLVHAEPGSALLHPRLSPAGDRLAWVATPGADVPPRRGAVARICVGAREAGPAEPVQIAGVALAPFDWNAAGDGVFATLRDGSLAEIALSRPAQPRKLGVRGRVPRISADGCLAYLAEGRLHVVGPDGARAFDLEGEPTRLAWAPAGGRLLVATARGGWRTRVEELVLEGGRLRPLFETARVDALEVVGALPAWPRG